LLAITLVAARGIVESALVNALFTVLQVGGLIWIIIAGAAALPELELPALTEFLPVNRLAWGGVMAGAFLAFYAFIGFEDMVNIAEEVRDPAATIPRGIMLALIISTVIYILLMVIAVITVAPAVLAASDAPLTVICEATPGCTPVFISLIGLTVINGALIQIIMASRILFGMSRSGWLPAFLSRLHAKSRTPMVATLIAGGIALLLALLLPFLSLAKLTSAIVLSIFVLVNAALIVIKRRGEVPADVKPAPMWVPLFGLAGSLLILIY
jgi:APA family basic amino acid/polyamine antiporter